MSTSNPPIPGHHLLNEGLILPVDHEDRFPRAFIEQEEPRKYSGGCQCGARPDDFPNLSGRQMKAWHRMHKERIRQDAHDAAEISKDAVIAALSGERVDRVKLMHQVLDTAEEALRVGDHDRVLKVIFVWSQRREHLLAGEETWEDEQV